MMIERITVDAAYDLCSDRAVSRIIVASESGKKQVQIRFALPVHSKRLSGLLRELADRIDSEMP